MSRQILTFIIVFAGLMFFMQRCKADPTAPPAITPENLRAADDLDQRVLLEDKARDVVVTLGPDGTLVSVTVGKQIVVREVNPWRRTFHLLQRTAEGRTRSLSGWTTEKLLDGFAFVHTDGTYSVRREVRLTPDGGGLECTLSATNAPTDVRDFLLTGISGVPLDDDAADTPTEPFLVRRIDEGRIQTTSWNTIVAEQERQRSEYLGRLREDEDSAGVANYHDRTGLRAGQQLALFGVLGAKHLVAFEQLPTLSAVSTQGYRLRRDGGGTRELETWFTLPAAARGYEGKFRIRWSTRSDAAKTIPVLAKVLKGRKETRTVLSNDTLELELTDRGAAVTSLLLKRYVRIADQENKRENWIPMIQDVVRPGNRTLTLLVRDPDHFGIDPGDAIWTVAEQTQDSIIYRLASPTGWVFEKRIALPREEDNYELDVSVRVTRPDGNAEESFPFTLIGPTASYIADAKRGVMFTPPPQGILLERGDGGDFEEIAVESVADKGETLEHAYGKETASRMRGIGARGAFFVAVLVTPEPGGEHANEAPAVTRATVRGIKFEKELEYLDGDAFSSGIQTRVDAKQAFGRDGVAASRFTLFAGPSELSRLRPLHIEEAVDFGYFAWIGRLLMWLMKTLQGFFGSYGVAIMVMTLIVRACLLPVSFKSQLSVQQYSKRMAKLKPLLEGLEAKFGKNRQKLNNERMKLMREHKVGFPLGCLMMFVQIPIWIALFAALRVEFTLRHEDFLWTNDLMMPDRLFGLPFYPNWFNLLPLLMLVLWVMQQKLSPQAMSDDPQVQAQMRMVRYMPYVFFLMLYNYASALSVYMCVSSAWGIAEAKLVRRAIKKLDV